MCFHKRLIQQSILRPSEAFMKVNIPVAFQILVFDNATISIYFIQNCIIKL